MQSEIDEKPIERDIPRPVAIPSVDDLNRKLNEGSQRDVVPVLRALAEWRERSYRKDVVYE
jgi:hypothetical protein